MASKSYTKRYARDEMAPLEGFGNLHLDEASVFDDEMVDLYQDTIDVL